jgi:hypothetical protein
MTDPSAPVVESSGPRAELMLVVRDPVDAFAGVWRRLAVLAAAPAVEGVVYRAGMTVDLGEPLAGGSTCTGVLVGASALHDIATPDGSVAVLEAVAATSNELAWCRVRGAAALRERWRAAGVDTADLARPSVRLDG